jgi:SAM-dependent methyltransferase
MSSSMRRMRLLRHEPSPVSSQGRRGERRSVMKLRELVNDPRVYDAIQAAAGARKVRERLRPHTRDFAGTRVLDVGAGTGGYIGVVPKAAEYVAIDLDPEKLERLRVKWPGVTTMVGDAARLDLPPESFDHALCTFLAHHLDDEGLMGLTAGLRLSLRDTLVFIDPLRVGRLRSRLLWSIDRGSYPRSADELLTALDRDFVIEHEERFAVHHAYLLCVARARR